MNAPTQSTMTAERYRELDADSRAMMRCFARYEALPEPALNDMRSLSIQGSSLARHIMDLAVASPPGTWPESVVMQAERMVERYEKGGW